jgi:heme exporter protein CcmD
MSEFLAMGGNGPYVWAAWGITLAVVIWNIWSARARLKRSRLSIGREPVATDAPRRPRVTQL